MKQQLYLRDLVPDFGGKMGKGMLARLSRGSWSPLRELSRLPVYSRMYQPGDSPRYIDWRVYGRSRQLLVREEQRKYGGQTCFILDCSDSMFWPGPDLPDLGSLHKFELAMRVLLHQLVLLQDLDLKARVFFIQDGENLLELHLNSKTAVLEFFGRCLASGFSKEQVLFSSFPSRLPSKVRVFYLGDGLGSPPYLVASGIFWHLMSFWEWDFSWLEELQVYRAQPRPQLRAWSGRQVRSQVSKIEAWRKNLEETTLAAGCAYTFMTEQTPLQDYYAFLQT